MVVEASEMARGCEVIGDCAYGAGETRVEFAASGQGPGRDGSGPQNQGYFTKTDFQIALQVAGTWTWPNQQQTARPAGQSHFD